MLDAKQIAKDPDRFRQALARRGAGVVAELEPFFALDERWRSLRADYDGKKHELRVAGKGFKGLDPKGDEAAALRAELAKLSDGVKALESEIREVEEARDATLLAVPNLPDARVPDGADEAANEEVATYGERPTFAFSPKPHWEVGEALGILDFERAAAMSGARFAVLKGDGARLERALINFMLGLHTTDHGYLEIFPPLLVRPHAMEGAGQLPKFADEAFRTAGDNPYYLIPTAEVPLVNLHREEIIEADLLPISYCAYTPCFRAEAGSYGKDVRGLIRQHQFNKVELVKITRPEASMDQLEQLRGHAEEVLKRLGLHFRTMILSTGDLGFASTLTYDLEVWLPGQDGYREISSCSNCGDFQARRSRIRYRHAPKDNRLVHTLNGSGLAVGRTLIAILENYQQADGSVVVPEVLREALGKDVITPR